MSDAPIRTSQDSGREAGRLTRRGLLRASAAFAVAAATGSILAACGGSGDAASATPAANPTAASAAGAATAVSPSAQGATRAPSGTRGGTMTFWQFYGPGGPVAPRDKWFQDTVKAWNDQNETKVRLEYVPSPAASYYSKVETAFAAGQGPDIFLLSPSDFLRYANANALVDLTPFMDDAAKKDFDPGAMGTRMVGDKIYALPMEVQPLAMYYSVKAWNEAGLTPADYPKTWDQLFAVAEKLKKGDRFGVLFPTEPGQYQLYAWYPFLWMGGGDSVTQDGKKSNIDSPGGIQALQFWQDAIKRGVAPRTALGTGGGDTLANLAAGYTAMQEVNIGSVGTLKANAPNFEYGVFKLPVPPGGTYTTDLGGWAFTANAKGSNPEAAAKFCVWAIGSMQDDSIQRMLDWCVNASTNMPPRKSVQEKGTQQGAYASGVLKTFKDEILPGARGEPRTPGEIWKALADALQACQLNGADPKQQAAQAAQKIDAFLTTYTGARIL